MSGSTLHTSTDDLVCVESGSAYSACFILSVQRGWRGRQEVFSLLDDIECGIFTAGLVLCG